MGKALVKSKKGFFYYVEKGGNALPHPAILFGLFALTALAVSTIGSLLGWHGMHPATGEQISVVNLMSREGVHRILLEMVTNYTSFAPLGIVMVALLGIGVAETSGLIKTAINAMLVKTPAKYITFMVVFTGNISNVASDLGYLLIIPLAGVIFHSLGRNPFAGMAAAFAGVSGGFSANIFISTLDPLLAGLSTEAAQIIDPDYYVLPTANYYFMAASTFLISIVGTVVTVKWTEPRFGKYTGDVEREVITQPTALEKKGLRRAGFVFLGWFVLLAVGLIPENGILRGDNGSLLNSPVLKGFVSLLFLTTASAGAVYGFTVGKFKKSGDVITGMNDSFKTLVSYLVLVFFAAQFIAWFRWSNLGLLLAINGAEVLQNANIGLIPLVILFVIFTAFTNFLMGSASAKWAIMGPVFIPIFMLLGYSPELSQAVFRVGDSITNVISPVMSFFALIIVYFQKYDKKAGIGTIIAAMLPFTITFFIGWTLLLIGWILLGLPLGPGVSLYYG
ncbi:MAG: AbgT family transporter [Tannerella sp.]|jgi:aminobenzoyl-glutamate transport protein|nr:AbgT family transporter [Tannerella sp.]